MEFLLFAIVGIIVAVISAATKQKPKQQQEQQQQGQQPQPPKRAVSDIQRAFNMLLDDFDGNTQSKQQQTYNYGQQQQKPQEPQAFAEGDSGWSGAQSRPAPAKPKPAATPKAAANKYVNVKLDRYFMDEPEQEQPLKVVTKTTGGLNLQFGKDELVRAVIYSEILARRR